MNGEFQGLKLDIKDEHEIFILDVENCKQLSLALSLIEKCRGASILQE